MCHYTLLVHNPSGYIIQCKKCGHFRFAYGTSELVLCDNELYAIYGKLYSQTKSSEKEDEFRKTIRIPLPDSRIMLALTPFEANEMLGMIIEARATVAVNELLRDFR